jgi:hypothetical protein
MQFMIAALYSIFEGQILILAENERKFAADAHENKPAERRWLIWQK